MSSLKALFRSQGKSKEKMKFLWLILPKWTLLNTSLSKTPSVETPQWLLTKRVALSLLQEAQVGQPEETLWLNNKTPTKWKNLWVSMTTCVKVQNQETTFKLGSTHTKFQQQEESKAIHKADWRAQGKVQRTLSRLQDKVNSEPSLPNKTKRCTKASLLTMDSKTKMTISKTPTT